MQVWIDTTSAIGTTEITDGRVLRANFTVPSGLVQKFRPDGVGGRKTINGVGAVKSNPTMEIAIEFMDLTQYLSFQENDVLKVRVRFNGALIETVSGTAFYEYVEFDIYGNARDFSWDLFEDANRILAFTIEGQKDATLGSDLKVSVQNARTSL